MKFMIDTNIYDALAEDDKSLKVIEVLLKEGLVEVLTTHIQEDEVNQIQVKEKIEKLKKVPTNRVRTSLFVTGTSRLGGAVLGSGTENGIKFTEIQKLNKRHTNDAIIAVTAAKEADVLVTEDNKLKAKVLTQSSTLEVWDFIKFTEYINSLLKRAH